MALSPSFHQLPQRSHPALLAIFCIACLLLAWWVVQQADADMRQSLIQQAQLVARSLDHGHIAALTGGKADLATPSYRRIKEQLVAAGAVHPQYRSVYLLVRSAEGRVVFLADSKPADPPDHASPGTVFEEVSAGFLRVFDARIPVVDGPVADRHGTRIAALIPLIDPGSGRATVLGLDVDARAWALEVAARSALPIGLMLVLLILAAAVLAANRAGNAAPRPVLKRLLPPLVVLLLLLFGIAASLLWHEHRGNLQRQLTATNRAIAAELQMDLKNHTQALATVIRTLTAEPRLQEALAQTDTNRLLADWLPLYDSLHREQNLTHFYFFDPQRICRLRLHKPEKHGDLINRFTLLEAERTGATASGLEIGPLGLVTLRVVRPVYRVGQFVGYVELGKEIEEILHDRHRHSGSHLAVTLKKDLVDRPQWEESLRSLGREAEWNRLERRVINYTSLGPRLPDAFVPLAAHGEGHPTEMDLTLADTTWRASALPLTDASGSHIGDLLVLTDITNVTAAFGQRLRLGATTTGVLLAAIVSFLVVLLRNTDHDIAAQLAVSRERTRRKARQREAIAQLVVDADVVGGDFAAAIESIAQVTAATMGVARVGVWRFSEDAGSLHCLTLYTDETGEFSSDMVLRMQDYPLYFEAIRQETRVCFDDAQQDDRTRELTENYLIPLGITSMLDAGIFLGGRLEGVVCLEHVGPARRWQADEDSFAGTVAALVAQVFLNTERNRAEKALQESEALFRALFADSPVSIIIHDRETGEIIDANPSACAHYGFTSVDELKTNEFWMEPPYAFDDALAWIRKAAREGTQQFEWLNRRVDGDLFWEQVHLSPLTIGGEQRILATTIDITALKRTEEALRKLSQAVEQSPASVVITDLKGVIEYVNPKFSDITGYTREEAIGCNPRILKSEATDSSVYVELWKTITSGGEWRGVFQNRKKTGEDYWEMATISPIRDHHGQTTHFLAVKEDITERKQTEELLRRQDALLQAVANSVHILLSEAHIDDAIRQALEIVGRATDQDRAYLFEHHVDPASGENLMSQRYEWVRDGVSVQIDNPELQNLPFDPLFSRWFDLFHRGEAVAGLVCDFPERERSILEPQDIVSLMVVPVEVDGRFWGFVGFDNCRTAYQWGADEQAILTSLAASLGTAIMRHRSEAALRESNLRLEEATRAKSLFLANMSHEIRTPMNAIIGMTHLVHNTELDRRQRDYVNQIQQAAQSLLRIINDILDFSKIEAGKLELEQVAFRLEDVVANALVLQRQPALDKHIELLFDLRSPHLVGEAGTFLGDPLRLEQILTNLLTNGVKFTDAGHVLLALEEVDRTTTTCALRLIVEDTGIGMTTEQIGQLFTEFTQADSSTTRHHGGTGLGLSIAKRLLALMGGDIIVASEPGLGSRFTCTLTLEPAPPIGDPDHWADRNRRALVVDDHAPARTVLCTMLGHFGVDCAEAASGQAALDLLGKTEAAYDFVFVDWVMPGMAGEELIEAIRTLPLPRRPVIVVVSAHDLESIQERCDRQGLCHFLPKPVLPGDLRNLMTAGHREENTEAAFRATAAHRRLQGMRILLVEDNQINQQIASEMLVYHGAIVDLAGNGQEALDMVFAGPQQPHHAILMDIQMPGMDGYEATRRLRAEPRSARVPIIAMTAHAMVEEKERCLKVGMNAHVAKPFTLEDLLGALTPYCPKATPGDPVSIARSAAMEAASPLANGLDLDKGLTHCAGSKELYDRILAGYEQEFIGLADTLAACLSRGQWTELATLVHGFKGLSGTIGALDLQTLAEEIERAAAAHSPQLPLLIDRLRSLLATTLADPHRARTAPAGTSTPGTVAQTATAVPELLEVLRSLLAESDSAAQDFWKEHEQIFCAALPAPLGRQMAQAIARFQFEEALSLLTAHLTP